MPCRRVTRGRILGCLVLALTATVETGCGHFRSQRREHESSSLLSSGPVAKITKRQAADVEIALGRSLEETGNLSEAEATYRNALKKNPKRADAEQRLAILADERGDLKEAAKHFEQALKLDPKNPDILCDQGYSFYLQRRWSEAEMVLRRALACEPRHARSHTNLGLVLARQGDREAALAEFARAGCDPSDAQSNLALVLAMEGRLDDARQTYTAALAAKPGSETAREGLRAANVALAGGSTMTGAESIAATTIPAPARTLDPAVTRTTVLLPPPPSTTP